MIEILLKCKRDSLQVLTVNLSNSWTFLGTSWQIIVAAQVLKKQMVNVSGRHMVGLRMVSDELWQCTSCMSSFTGALHVNDLRTHIHEGTNWFTVTA